MSHTTSVQDAWSAYDGAIRAFYAPPAKAGARTVRGGGEVSAKEMVERSLAVLDQSQQFGNALVAALKSEDLDQRELAGWKLAAAAAHDLCMAADLLQAEEAGRKAARTRSARSALASAPELKEVLEAPLDAKISKLARPATRGVLPKDAGAAKQNLEKTIATFLKEIPDAAAAISQTAVSGVVTVGLVPAQQVASVAVQEILARLPDATSVAVRRGAQLLAEAVRKLQAALGEDVQQQAQDEASSWLKDIQENRDTVTGLLDKLYETQRIGEDADTVMAAAAAATTPADCYNQATRALEDLLARYRKTKQILENLMRVLAFIKAPLLAAMPWGPIGVYGTYAGVFAYAIFSGGDYLDWYRLGGQAWLDRVKGLRSVMHVAVQVQGS